MAYMKQGTLHAEVAAADLTGKLNCLAKIGSTGIDVQTTAGGMVLGTITEENVAGKSVTVQLDGIGKVIAGGNIARGDRLAPDTNGHAVADTTAGHATFGIALEAGVSGEVVPFAFARGQNA